MSDERCDSCGFDKENTRKVYESQICNDCLIGFGVESIREKHQQAPADVRSSVLYTNLTASAIRAAVAESGASEMLVSGALILALLDAAERNERIERIAIPALKFYADQVYSHRMGPPCEVQWIAENAIDALRKD